jgi:hypothetical protein
MFRKEESAFEGDGSMYPIESGILIPCRRGKYPFEKLMIGESFFVGSLQKSNGLSSAGRYWGKKLDRKFATRTLDDGVRVWRIA